MEKKAMANAVTAMVTSLQMLTGLVLKEVEDIEAAEEEEADEEEADDEEDATG